MGEVTDKSSVKIHPIQQKSQFNNQKTISPQQNNQRKTHSGATASNAIKRTQHDTFPPKYAYIHYIVKALVAQRYDSD